MFATQTCWRSRADMAHITIEGLGYRYPDAAEETLSDVTLDVPAGEAHALLGASGAGKSTMLALLSGLLRPSRGRVLFDGQDVTPLAARHRNVAQVFQFPVLYDGMNVLKNLTFPLTQRGFTKEAALQRARHIAERLEISELLLRKANDLSLFQKQLVAVGRAIVRPDVALVLLDEPLTAVQPSTKTHLRHVLKEVQRDLHVTMIYVTHDQTEALTFATAISVMANGGLLQTAAAETLYNEPAHEIVAHFVGDPGMNLLDAEVRGGQVYLGEDALGPMSLTDGPVRLGFRAEWVALDAAHGLPGKVLRRRDAGTRQGAVVGVADVSVVGQTIRAAYHGPIGELPRVSVRRFVGFRGGIRVA